MTKDSDEGRVIHWKSDNTETLINDKTDDVIEEIFQSFFSKYQLGLKTSMKDLILFYFEVILCFILFIYCMKNVIKEFLKVTGNI